MRFWFAGDGNLTEFNPLGFLWSFIHVYEKHFGETFFVIIFALWLWIVWNRSRSTELIIVGIAGIGSTWGLLLPSYTYPYFVMILGMAAAAILYRLMKTKKWKKKWVKFFTTNFFWRPQPVRNFSKRYPTSAPITHRDYLRNTYGACSVCRWRRLPSCIDF